MFIRIDWAKPNSDGHQMYHMYSCNEYFVEYLGWNGSSSEPSKPSQVRLMLDGSKHDICLSGGDAAYIMNDQGKTIDTIRT